MIHLEDIVKIIDTLSVRQNKKETPLMIAFEQNFPNTCVTLMTKLARDSKPGTCGTSEVMSTGVLDKTIVDSMV